MDLNNIRDQVSNLTLYDLKAGVRKVQNAVMNFTEMEAKVREATNNEPWGASSTLMQEIANGTHSYQLLNEIMPMIYKRFTEKAAEEWRQIYKALQLLEFLIKNGSERVIDDARSHLSLLKMLRQFHFIDQNGKDQGLNVRNRSKELAELLSDVDRIRTERKKARTNRNKFGGVEGGAMSGGLAGGSRYGGFGSEEAGYGGYSGGVYGDGGGFGGRDPTYEDTTGRRDRFEEYDENVEDGSSSHARRRSQATTRETKPVEPSKPKEAAVDFLTFDDDVPPKTPPKDFGDDFKAISAPGDDDEFDDFQSATPTTSNISKPTISPPPTASGIASLGPNLGNFSANLSTPSAASAPSTIPSPAIPRTGSNITPGPNYNINMSAPPPQQQKPLVATHQQPQPQQPKSTGYQASTPNYFTSVQLPQGPQSSSHANVSTPATSRPSVSSSNSFSSSKPAAATPNTSSGDAFGSLWSSASSSAGIKKAPSSGSQGPNLASLQREKASQGIWGHSTAPGSGLPQSTGTTQGSGAASRQTGGGGAFDDLLG